MALDGIYVHHLVKELHENINRSRLESVWTNGLYFVFQFYKEKKRSYLTFNLNASFVSCYLTNQPVSKGESTNFSASLKKHLEGGILTGIKQYLSDRVIIFNFTVHDFILGPIERTLIFEAMGRHANLYLTENNKIIDVYKRMFVLEGRHLVPNATFEYFLTDKDDAKTYIFNPVITPKEITLKYLGISLRLAKYLSEHPVHPYDIEVLPTLSLIENKSYFFNLFEGEAKSFSTLSEALSSRVMDERNDKLPFQTFIKNYLKRLDKKHEQLLKQNLDAVNHLSDKDKGDAIYQSGLDLTSSLKFVGDIELDEKKSLSKNAQSFYKHYQKSKRALDFIDQEIGRVLIEKEVFENYLKELEISGKYELDDFKEILMPYGYLKQSLKNKNRLSKHKIKVLTIKDSDATYFIGKNALQNAHLINEIGQKNDYWFHLRDAPGSHVLARTDALSESVIRKAATLAAYFSTFRTSSSIPINYTLFRNVSKISGKPASFVKIKYEKTIFIDIDLESITDLINNA